jgi:hypothetical protein
MLDDISMHGAVHGPTKEALSHSVEQVDKVPNCIVDIFSKSVVLKLF